MNLREIILLNLKSQLRFSGNFEHSSVRLREILDNSCWVYSEYDIVARSGRKITSYLKRFLKKSALHMNVNSTKRFISPRLLPYLSKHRTKILIQNDISKCLIDNPLTKKNIRAALKLETSDLNKQLNLLQKNWVITKIGDVYWLTSDYLDFITKNEKLTSEQIKPSDQMIISKMFERYPVLTSEQISLLTGIDFYDSSIPLSNLIRDNRISVLDRTDKAKVQYFISNSFDVKKESHVTSNFPPIVFSKNDCFVELLKLEKEEYAKNKNSHYWLFIDGLPVIEFNLKKTAKNKFSIENINKFEEISFNDIRNNLENWALTVNITIQLEHETSDKNILPRLFARKLLSRGYFQEKSNLKLNFRSFQSNIPSRLMAWNDLSPWVLSYFRRKKTVHALLTDWIQIDNLDPLVNFLQTPKDLLDLKNCFYFSGIALKMGYIASSLASDILNIDQINYRTNLYDQQLLKLMESPQTIASLATLTSSSIAEIKNRLTNLELNRLIIRNNDFERVNLLTFVAINHSELSQYLEKQDRITSLANLIHKLLQSNIPLSAMQIMNFFKLPQKLIMQTLTSLKRRNLIVEGYFLAFESEIQYSTEKNISDLKENITILKENQSLEDEPRDITHNIMEKVNFLPQSNPWTKLHLNNLITSHPSLLVTKKVDKNSIVHMILWEGNPIGYFLKIPSDTAIIDYDFEIKLRKSYVNLPLIGNIMEAIVIQNRKLYQDNIRILTINDEPVNTGKFESLNFLMSSLGIK